MKKIDELILKGIEDTRRAFTGPRIVQVDLTGRCNNNCIGCWVHSPYIKNPPRDKNLTIPYEKVKEIIEDLSRLGTEEIFLSGAGEPFLHPNILEIIELIKNKGLKLNIITNFTLVDAEKAKRLIDLNVDMLTVSTWAATPETYTKTHPGKTKEDFYKIKENLKNLSRLKAQENRYLPYVKIYNVICNQNHREIQQVIDFALDTQTELIEFQVIDIIEKETSFLALSNKQAEEIKEQFIALRSHNDLHFKEIEFINLPDEKELKEFPGRFLRIPTGFFYKEWIEEEDEKKIARHYLICPKGFRSKASKSNPLIEEEKHKITFSFLKEYCHVCPLFKTACPIGEDCKISIKYLRTISFGPFMRRINSVNLYDQIYEKDLIENLPCFMGWLYSRILSTGEVIPCCKAANKPVGNVNQDNFSAIWHSDSYNQFRYKAKLFSKVDSYFKDINCFKSCDNVGMNLRVRESLNQKQQDLNYPLPIARELTGRCDLPEAKVKLIIPAGEFKSGNLNIQNYEFGKGVVIGSGMSFSFVEYQINLEETGKYELWVYYATEYSRPVKLYFDGNLITREALNSITPGWTTEDLRWFKEANLDITKGEHTLKISSKGQLPHIHSFAFLKGIKDLPRSGKKYLSDNIYQQLSAFRLLKDKIKTKGLPSSFFKLLNHIVSGRLINDYLDILGIFNRRYAFKGPFHVQIDLTNNCNNNCVACWCNSPLLEEKALPPEVKKQTLPFGLLKEFLDELSQMGTKEIYFSGGGEPFIHPQIMRILEYAKRKNFTCYVNTNFTLLNKDNLQRLIELGVEHLTVSLWAATAKTYVATHPNKNEDTFRQIIENLKFLNNRKRKTPYIKLYNVIFNLNFQELRKMVMLAKETNSESVEFTLVDTIPGKTDRLILSPDQIRELQTSAQEIADELDERSYLDGVLLFRFDSFLRRISFYSDLVKATYDRNIIDKIPCYIGWCFSRIMPNGDVNACLKAHRIPMGNLYQASFKEIWNGEKQRYFRKKTLVYQKKDPFFRLIGNDPEIKEAGCYKSCDDIGRNIYIHNRIMSLTPLERQLLKIAVKVKPKPKLG